MHNPVQDMMPSQAEDESVLRGHGWERLTSEDWSRLQGIGLGLAHRLTSDFGLAEDLAAEAILRLGQRLSVGATVEAPVSYLCATVRHLAADHHRRQRLTCLTLDASDDERLGRSVSVHNRGINSDPTAAAVEMIGLFASLPPLHRKALVYRALGYTNLEIAKALGLGGAGTVAVLVCRARSKLLQSLES